MGFFFFEKWSHGVQNGSKLYVAKDDLELLILLSHSPSSETLGKHRTPRSLDKLAGMLSVVLYPQLRIVFLIVEKKCPCLMNIMILSLNAHK